MPDVIMGCDVSTKDVAYCIVGKDVKAHGYLDSQEHVPALCSNYSVTAIYIERIPYCQNQQIAVKLSEAVGRLQQMILNCGREYNMISVAKWKMLAVGNGQAGKPEVKRVMILTTSLEDGEKQDIYDACGIAIAGQALEKEKEYGR